MAIDTRQKRTSAGNMPWMPIAPNPDATIDAHDRAQITGYYGAIPITYYQNVSGVFGMTGALIKLTDKQLAGDFGMSGILVKLTDKQLAGGFDMAATLATEVFYTQNNDGSLDMTGALSKITNKELAGPLAFTGAVTVRNILKALSGQLNMSGTLSRFTSRYFSGQLNMTGSLTTAATFVKSVAGILSGWVGSVTGQKVTPYVRSRLRKFINWFGTFGG